MKRIRAKLMLAFFGMAALAVALIWLVQAVFLGDSYLNQRISSIDSALSGFTIQADSDYASLESALNISLLAVNDAGSVVYQSEGLPMRGQIVKRIPELTQASASGTQPVELGTEQARYALLSRAVEGGTVLAVFSLVDVSEASRVLLQQLWVITAALLLAALLLSLLLSRRFSRPIVEVTSAAKRMAAGDYGVVLQTKSRDEIGQLTRALNELGQELNKTEELRRELIANVSHELRAPLTIIRGYAETVRDVTWPIEAKREEQLNAIVEESARLNRLVGDILDYSKLQSGAEACNPVAFSGVDALGELVGRFSLAASQRGITLSLFCPAGDVLFDRGQFVQVVSNLLDNAVRHARDNTCIAVRGVAGEKNMRISVENEGVKIPAEELTKIWDRYHRAPKQGEAGNLGTGLGLAIVKTILEQHKVDYGVESDENKTVFWFETVPLA